VDSLLLSTFCIISLSLSDGIFIDADKSREKREEDYHKRAAKKGQAKDQATMNK
jgi:hypothetical protein